MLITHSPTKYSAVPLRVGQAGEGESRVGVGGGARKGAVDACAGGYNPAALCQQGVVRAHLTDVLSSVWNEPEREEPGTDSYSSNQSSASRRIRYSLSYQYLMRILSLS